jgi:hypothetical protein
MTASRVIRRSDGSHQVIGGSAQDRRGAILESVDDDVFSAYTVQTFGHKPKMLEALFRLHGKVSAGAQIGKEDRDLLHRAYAGRVDPRVIDQTIGEVNDLPAATRGQGLLYAMTMGDPQAMESVKPVLAEFHKQDASLAVQTRLEARSPAADRTVPAFDPKGAGAATADANDRRATIAHLLGKRPLPSEGVQRHRVANVIEAASGYLQPQRDALGRDIRDPKAVVAAAYDLHAAQHVAEQHLGLPKISDADIAAAVEADEEAQFGDGAP